VLRDYAREAAKSAGVRFSQWVEGAVRRAVAEESWAGVLLRQRDEAQAELAFLRKEYGDADANTLTRDALELKLQVMEQQRDEERKQHDALRAVWVAASDWLNHLAQNRVHYSDDGFGNLLDAVYAADARMTGKP
jgi:hypothetical protein